MKNDLSRFAYAYRLAKENGSNHLAKIFFSMFIVIISRGLNLFGKNEYWAGVFAMKEVR